MVFQPISFDSFFRLPPGCNEDRLRGHLVDRQGRHLVRTKPGAPQGAPFNGGLVVTGTMGHGL